MRVNSFIEDQSGAVTVDWTVMTAAIVGLGIATYGVVSGGIQDLSGDVDLHLRQDLISTSFGPLQLASMDFTGGNKGGWIGGTVLTQVEALGEILVLDPGETVSLTVDVPAWKESVPRVTVTVDDPGETLALGMTSGADENVGREFFGIDNVGISAQKPKSPI